MTQPTALLFPGQGAQRPGMGRPWVDTDSWSVVETLERVTGRDLTELLLRADAATLKRPDHAQLATFALELMILAELERGGFPFGSVIGCAGHSLGEYAALVACGVLTPDAAGRLVAVRADAVLGAALRHPGSMAVIMNLDGARASALVDRARAAGAALWVAGVNAAHQITVSGSADDLAGLGAAVRELGGRQLELRVGGAFHSPLMATAVPPVAACYAGIRPGRPSRPLVANVDGRARTDADWSALAAEQLVRPVQWRRTLCTLTEDLGARLHLEIGPGTALRGLTRLYDPELVTISVATPADVAEVLTRSPERA